MLRGNSICTPYIEYSNSIVMKLEVPFSVSSCSLVGHSWHVENGNPPKKNNGNPPKKNRHPRSAYLLIRVFVPSFCSTTVFGVSTESMQLSYDSRGNIVPTILLLMQRRLYAQGGLQVFFLIFILHFLFAIAQHRRTSNSSTFSRIYMTGNSQEGF